MATEVTQVLGTLGEVMSFMAPNHGGSVPNESSEEYSQWRLAIQLKYEEASKRGPWRRLLTKDDTLSVREGDESITMPIRFQRANALYIFAYTDADGNLVDLADPDREPDGQSLFAELISDPDDSEYGYWRLNFAKPIEADSDVILWYWAIPAKPVETDDKILLPGDMVAFGAMSEVFRISNLPGSQDDARNEYENRLSSYLALESVPPRNELIKFITNPRRLDRTVLARNQYLTRPYRNGRSL